MQTHQITSDVTVLSDSIEIPGIGFLPVNTFVLHATQPVVIDTGLASPTSDFVSDLGGVIDPADVRWIWLTHPDRDHTGACSPCSTRLHGHGWSPPSSGVGILRL